MSLGRSARLAFAQALVRRSYNLSAADKTLYERQIEAADRHIDGLVYELYGLTEEEIGIVEGRLNHE